MKTPPFFFFFWISHFYSSLFVAMKPSLARVCVHAHTVRSKGPSLQLRTGFISSTVNYINKCGLDDELEFKLSENVVKINLSFEKDFEREI